MRGHFGVAMYFPKTEMNVGSLWRTAHILGASYIATIGRRYRRQSSDTMHTTRHLPLFHYETFEDFYKHLPYDTQLVAVELTDTATEVTTFPHPQRACYLLGAEDIGIPNKVLDECHHIVRLLGERSMNVAVAGSIVLYDRVTRKRVA